jgi:hypothetical protein
MTLSKRKKQIFDRINNSVIGQIRRRLEDLDELQVSDVLKTDSMRAALIKSYVAAGFSLECAERQYKSFVNEHERCEEKLLHQYGPGDRRRQLMSQESKYY